MEPTSRHTVTGRSFVESPEESLASFVVMTVSRPIRRRTSWADLA
jgi:hypothetical protein